MITRLQAQEGRELFWYTIIRNKEGVFRASIKSAICTGYTHLVPYNLNFGVTFKDTDAPMDPERLHVTKGGAISSLNNRLETMIESLMDLQEKFVFEEMEGGS